MRQTQKVYMCMFYTILASPLTLILVRNAGPSSARNAIVIANIVGFACVTSMDVWGVFSGDARQMARLFLVIHMLMTVGFVLAGRAGMRTQQY
jgi:hypothetical protein